MDIVLVIPEDSIILDLGTGHGLVLIKFASKISSEAMTLTYLGLDQASRETMLDQIDFG